MLKTVKGVEMKNKKVLVRVDFNIPLKKGGVADDNRIKTAFPTINYLARKKAKIIVAIGACACYGSVKGLANLYDKEDLIKRKFMETESITDENPKEPISHMPGIEDYIVNVKDIIDVDMFIPGCPPTTENIIAAISYLLTLVGEGPESLDKNTSVCDKCNLNKEGCFFYLVYTNRFTS